MDINGKSNYFNIFFDDSGINYIGELEDKSVYTYNTSDVGMVDFFANYITLEEAVEKKAISIDRIVKHLHKEKQVINEHDITRYMWENYQIILIKDTYIIGSNQMDISFVINDVFAQNK